MYSYNFLVENQKNNASRISFAGGRSEIAIKLERPEEQRSKDEFCPDVRQAMLMASFSG